MLRILKKENGNLSIVMLMAVIGMVSGLTMSGMVLRDFRNYSHEYELAQTKHLLRAEAYRGQNYLINNPLPLNATFILPANGQPKRIDSGKIVRHFKVKSRLEKKKESTVLGSSTGASITDMVDAFKLETIVNVSTSNNFGNMSGNSSQLEVGAVLTLNQTTFAEFMYFTDQDTSPAGKNVYFYGKDVIEGKVHSNSDIRIKQAGGGSNNGWPTFLNLVTTSGEIVSDPPVYPVEDVFRGGLIEEYDQYDFPASAETLRRNAQLRYGTSGAADRTIYMITVNGSAGQMNQGNITSPQRAWADVWDPFPPDFPPSDSLYRNQFTVQDTIWTSRSISGLNNKGIFVTGTLWLEGVFSGYQTWGCSENIYLIGDIKLNGTALGASPISNRRDMIGIVSEKSIIVKYAYMNPTDSVRVHPNVGPHSAAPEPAGGGIFIYAAMCALGDGGTSEPTDVNFNHGVFTFEYQHPHGSTPAVYMQDDMGELYYFDWIDLHRRRYPPTTAQPWPAALDYPWYNPIWPERNPIAERGTINIYGAVAQRRRGFVHRSGNDPEYPSNDGVWNIEEDMCGGPVVRTPFPDPVILGMVLQTRDYPGADTGGVGYRKNYNFDKRFLVSQPLYYPEAQLQGGKKPMTHGTWSVVVPGRHPDFNGLN